MNGRFKTGFPGPVLFAAVFLLSCLNLETSQWHHTTNILLLFILWAPHLLPATSNYFHPASMMSFQTWSFRTPTKLHKLDIIMSSYGFFSSIPFQGVDILRLKLPQPPRAHQTWTQKTRKSGLAVVLVKTSHTICSVSIQLSTTLLVSLISFLTKSMSIASRKSFTTTLSPWAWSYTGLLSVVTSIRSFPQILDHLWGCSHDTWPPQQVQLKIRLSCYIDNHGWGV